MHTRSGAAVVIALCVAIGGYAVLTRPPTPFSAPDTAAYVNASPLVPMGYPLFLELFGVSGAAVAQPIVFAVALAGLGVEVLALSGSLLLALVLTASMMLVPDLMSYHASILSESLFISGLVGFLAATSRFARVPSWRAVLVAALIAGVSASIRRTAYALAPVVVLMVVLRWRRMRQPAHALAAALVPLMLLYAADRVVTQYRHGEALTSLTGRHLFAKAALLDAPPSSTDPGDQAAAQLSRALDTAYRPIRTLIATAPRDVRASLVLFYETCLQGPCVNPLRESLGLPEAATNLKLAEAGWTRIASAPLEFAALTATHYASLWTVYKLQHPITAERLTTFLASHRPLPFERETFKVNPDDAITFRPSAQSFWLQPLVLAIGLLTLALAVLGVLRPSASSASFAAALAAFTAHGCLLLTAVAAAGIARFMIAVFPAVILATGLGLWALIAMRSAQGQATKAES